MRECAGWCLSRFQQRCLSHARRCAGYYQHGDGDGFQAVNSGGTMNPPPVTLPPNLYPEYIIGPGQYGTFTSEFGCA
jgi:hypothetical protein